MSLDSKVFVAILRKNPVLSGCALTSVVLLLIIYFRFDLISSAQEELDQKNAEGKKYHANVVNGSQLTAQLAEVVAANRSVHERAMHPGDLAKNLQYFYHIEAATGVKYTDLKIHAVTKDNKLDAKTYIPIGCSITVQGEFSKIIVFLKHLEQGFYFYRLNTMVATTVGANITLTLNVDFIGQP